MAQQIKFSEYNLKNGLHVILHEDHSTPIVAVTVLYHVGSKNEQVGRTGMAHFRQYRVAPRAKSSLRWSLISVIVPTVDREVRTGLV